MDQFLKQHVVDNVWASPRVDQSLNVELYRTSSSNGAISTHIVMNTTIELPTDKDLYHVYQIGYMPPDMIGLLGQLPKDRWRNIQEIVNNKNVHLLCHLFTNSGIHVSPAYAHILLMRNGNVMIAIQEIPQFQILRAKSTKLFLRFYTNAFFSVTENNREETTHHFSVFIKNNSDRQLFQNRLLSYSVRPGGVNIFRNGVYESSLMMGMVALGDLLEFEYDPSIVRKVRLQVKDLKTFTSELDAKNKYLVHMPKENKNRIRYVDDVDVYITANTQLSPGFYRGVYHAPITKDWLRQLTHQDYSIPVNSIFHLTTTGYRYSHFFPNIDRMFVELIVRQDEFINRDIIVDKNRINELYKMDDARIIKAMLGLDSLVDEWRAENLEKSEYIKLMSDPNGDFKTNEILKAYGYDTTAKILSDSPVRAITLEGKKAFRLSGDQLYNVTIFEYDENGVLLEHYYLYMTGATPFARNQNAAWAEVILGKGSIERDVIYGADLPQPDSMLSYRCYICLLEEGMPDFKWIDVTNNSSIVSYSNGISFINIDRDIVYTAIVSDSDFICREHTIPRSNGVVWLTVTSEQLQFGDSIQHPDHIPTRVVDIFLNKRPLIQNLDYIVNWPHIVITNVKYQTADNLQNIIIRANGFCNRDMTLDKPREYGFVANGLLSKDGYFNIRDGSVMHLITDGRLYPLDHALVGYAENSGQAKTNGLMNGTPYMLRETLVPFRTNQLADMYSLRERTMALRKKIEEYITNYLPEPTKDLPTTGVELYPVYSPFITRIIFDLQQDIYVPDFIFGSYSEMDIREACRRYEFMLQYDLAHIGHDSRYVIVRPIANENVIELSVHKFNFVKRVIDLYFDGSIYLNHFIKITG